jgi:hypothetical protein
MFLVQGVHTHAATNILTAYNITPTSIYSTLHPVHITSQAEDNIL